MGVLFSALRNLGAPWKGLTGPREVEPRELLSAAYGHGGYVGSDESRNRRCINFSPAEPGAFRSGWHCRVSVSQRVGDST